MSVVFVVINAAAVAAFADGNLAKCTPMSTTTTTVKVEVEAIAENNIVPSPELRGHWALKEVALEPLHLCNGHCPREELTN